jgi:hypothetical protein
MEIRARKYRFQRSVIPGISRIFINTSFTLMLLLNVRKKASYLKR